MIDNKRQKVEGFVLIRYPNTGEKLVDKKNAIHYENLSESIALSLGNRSNGFIQNMAFGNGASTVSGIGTVTYFAPNTSGSNAALYNQTYTKPVNDASPLNLAPETNYIRVNHLNGNVYTDVITTCLLDYNEPSGQAAFDDSTTENGDFIFDELGLVSYDSSTGGKLLTHVIFHPVQKSLNRQIEVVYTLRIYMT